MKKNNKKSESAVLTNLKKIAERCYVLRDHGMLRTSNPIKRYTKEIYSCRFGFQLSND